MPRKLGPLVERLPFDGEFIDLWWDFVYDNLFDGDGLQVSVAYQTEHGESYQSFMLAAFALGSMMDTLTN